MDKGTYKVVAFMGLKVHVADLISFATPHGYFSDRPPQNMLHTLFNLMVSVGGQVSLQLCGRNISRLEQLDEKVI